MATVVAGGALLGWQLSRGLEALLSIGDFRSKAVPCLEIGVPFHHRLRANCSDTLPTPRGMIPFSTNEDRLRDLSRHRILGFSHRILVIGGGEAAGETLPAEQSLPSGLGARTPGTYFVNGLIHGGGPFWQSLRLSHLVATYRPDAVLVILTPSAFADDEAAFGAASGKVPAPRERCAGFSLLAEAGRQVATPLIAVVLSPHDMVEGLAGCVRAAAFSSSVFLAWPIPKEESGASPDEALPAEALEKIADSIVTQLGHQLGRAP